MTGGTQWGRAILAAITVEAVLILATIPVAALIGIEAFVPYVPVACFVAGFLVVYGFGRKFRSAFFWHGLLVGIIATLIYLSLVFASSGSFTPVIELYGLFLLVFSNLARTLGCIAGAVAARRRAVAGLSA
jgi:hypothetical protein